MARPPGIGTVSGGVGLSKITPHAPAQGKGPKRGPGHVPGLHPQGTHNGHAPNAAPHSGSQRSRGKGGANASNAAAAAKRAAKLQTQWLTPLSPQQVRQTATREVRSAYKPLYGQLNQQQSNASSIYAKQQADNEYYNNWLSSKTQQLQGVQDSVNAQTNAMEHQLTTNQLAQYGPQASTLVNAANQRAGNVSNNQQSTAFGQDLAANQADEKAQLGLASQRMLENEQSSQAILGAGLAGEGGFVQGVRQSQTDALNKALTDIGQQRQTLQGKQSGDLEKEVARLQGVQATIAQNTQNAKLAAQELGLKTATVKSENKSRAVENAVRIENANLARDRVKLEAVRTKLEAQGLSERQIKDNQNFKLAADRVRQAQQRLAISQQQGQQRINIAQQNANTSAFRATHPSSGRGSSARGNLTASEQNTIYGHLDTIVGNFHRLISAGDSPQKAYHDLQNGVRLSGADVPPAGNTVLLNAAYNVARGFGLTTGDVRQLTKMGLVNPGRRYAKHTIPTGGAGSNQARGGAAHPHSH